MLGCDDVFIKSDLSNDVLLMRCTTDQHLLFVTRLN